MPDSPKIPVESQILICSNQAATLPGYIYKLGCLGVCSSEGLVNDYVPSCQQTLFGQRVVGSVGCGNDYEFDFFNGQQFMH